MISRKVANSLAIQFLFHGGVFRFPTGSLKNQLTSKWFEVSQDNVLSFCRVCPDLKCGDVVISQLSNTCVAFRFMACLGQGYGRNHGLFVDRKSFWSAWIGPVPSMTLPQANWSKFSQGSAVGSIGLMRAPVAGSHFRVILFRVRLKTYQYGLYLVIFMTNDN